MRPAEGLLEKIAQGIVASAPSQFCAEDGIEGIAHCVQSYDDLLKFEQGFVLVTRMTNADMIAAMYGAAAIVTDEGGINSHAGVTARELDIPCITGTKVATRSIVSGDCVYISPSGDIYRYQKRACP